MNNFTTCSGKGNKVESKQGRFTRVLRACTMVAAMLLMVTGISLDAAAQSVKSCAVKKAPSASMTLKGGMPQSAKVQATKVDRSTNNGKHVYGAYDITITNGTAEWQPAGGAPVMVSITDPNFADGTLLDVYHEGANGNEFVATVSPTNHTITFPAHSFSVYIVGESDDVARLKVNFVQSGGNTVSIYVKPADIGEHFNSIVYDPGVGVLASGVHFRGWTTNQNYTIDDIAQGKTIADVRDEVQTELEAGVSEGDEITYYAMLIKSYSITYLDENNAAIGASEIAFRADDQSGSAREYTVSNAYTPGDNMHNFEGWFIRLGGSNVQEYTGPEQNFENGTTIHVSGDVVFGVNSAEGHWLIYRENGKGATYKAADFVKSGEVTVEPTINMIRPGYTFQGWFLGPLDATNVENPVPTGDQFVFGQQLTDNTEIFAKWQANTTAGYTVIIWRQNLAGNGYDYVEAISLTGNVGSTINTVTQQGTGNNAYARVNGVNKQYTGFHLNNFDQNVTIKTEGNSIINIYYDRNQHTLTFRPATGNQTLYTITALYQQDISSHFPIPGYTSSRWMPQNSSYFTNVIVFLQVMPDEDITFRRNTDNNRTKNLRYFVEINEGETPDQTYEGKQYKLYLHLPDAALNIICRDWDFVDINGYEQYTSNRNFPTTGEGHCLANTVASADFYYIRKTFKINFMDGAYFDGNGNQISEESGQAQIDEVDGIPYGSDITSYNNYTPSSAPAGYAFEGWYVDKACQSKFDFTTMPDGGLTVFAKWRQIQYRVFLHPNADHITALDWGSDNQAMNFRISYGGKISAPTGVDGNGNYEFVGWYTDAALLNAFSEDAVVLNEQTVTTPYDKTTDFTDPMDKWGNGATSNSDITGNEGTDRFWITKKYDIYGKWRAVLNGANGIDVEYVANGGDASTLPSDDNLYQDNVDATAGAACSYVDDTKVFSHWVVQKWNAEQEEYQDLSTTVFPGAPFTVLKDNAKMDIKGYANPNDPEDISETEDATHTNLVATYTVRLRAEWVDAETHTPTFIVWYNNYEGAATDTLCQYGKINYTDPHADLHINEAKNIPTPAARDGYTFKGWFKKQWQPNETVTTTIQECTPNFLTYENGNYYSVPEEGETAVQATQVAADEANPYDYLYAIWEPTVEFTSPVKYCQNTTGSLPTPTTAPEDLTFTWSLNGNTVTTVNTQTAGTFTYTWTTADGCKTGEVQVVVNPLPTITATATPATICAGGESQLSATGATSYMWDAPATPEIDGKVSPSETTTYHVTGTDANGCVNYAEVTVNVKQAPTVTLTGADACFGNAATITPALAEGSSTPTHYKWSTDDAWSAWPTTGAPDAKTFSETGEHSAAMSVKIQIDEEQACEATSEEVTVKVNPMEEVTVNGSDFCEGSSTELSVAQTETAITSYKWSDNSTGDKLTVSEAGTYSVTVTFEGGCTATGSKTVAMNQNPEVTFSPETLAVCVGDDVTLKPTVSPAASEEVTYSYNWSDESTDATVVLLNVQENASYSITVTNEATGCSNNASVNVQVNPAVTITVTPANPTCLNNNGSLAVAVQDPVQGHNYSYYYYHGSSESALINQGATITIPNLAAGNYAVYAVDNATHCQSDQKEVTLTVDPEEYEALQPTTIEICSGSQFSVTPVGATDGMTYSWSAPTATGVEGLLPGEDQGTVHGTLTVAEGTTGVVNVVYTVTPTIGVCPLPEVDMTVKVTANVHTPATLTLSALDTVCANSQPTVTATIENSTAPATLTWSYRDEETTTTVESGTATFNPSTALDEGCTGTFTLTLKYEDNICPAVTTSTEVVVGVKQDWKNNITDGGTIVACASEAVAPGAQPVVDGCTNTITPVLTKEPTAEEIKAAACGGELKYEYTYTDCAGNSKIYTYTYTIKHTQAPTLATAASATESTVDCYLGSTDAPHTVDGFVMPVVKDQCGNVIPTPEPTGTNDYTCSQGGDFVYKYVYKDCSDESLTYTWTYTYHVKPITVELKDPENTLKDIENINDCYSADYSDQLASDVDVLNMYTTSCPNVSTISVAHGDDVVVNDDCGWSITRTFTITTNYNQHPCTSIEVTQKISGKDLTAPVINTESDNWVATMQAERGADCSYVVPDLTSMVKSNTTDNCTEASALTVTQAPEAGTTVSENTTVKVTVADACSNSSEETVSITIPESVITVTTPTKSWTYDGQSHSEAIFTLTNGNVTETDAQTGTEVTLPNGDKATVTVSGSVTNVSDGEVTNAAEVVVKDAEGTDVTCYYTVEKTEGKLSINPSDDMTLTCPSANDATKVYDGEPLAPEATATGVSETDEFTIEYSTDGQQWSTTAPSITNVGEQAVQVRATNPNYVTETCNYTLKVTPATLTITAKDQTYTYNGEAQGPAGTYAADFDAYVTVEGLKGDDALTSITLAGRKTYAGTYTDEIVPSAAEIGENTANYTITYTKGTLTITKAPAEEITMDCPTADDATKKYDGQPLALAASATGIGDDTFTIEYSIDNGETWNGDVPSITNVGEQAVKVRALNDNYETAECEYTLTITKREVTLASASDTKEYDGNPLTNDEITVGGDGFAEGEGATYDVTGTQTLVGSSTNTFSYTLNEGTSEDNYTITKTEGTLTVTDRTPRYPIEVVSNSETVTYDGEEHTAEGFETLSFTTVDGNDYTVEGLTATVTKTDAGTYDNTITGTPVVKDEDGNDVTDQFDVTLVNGKLVINPANLVIELDSTKIYDGTKFVVSYEQLHVTGLVSRDHITGGTVTSEDYVVGVYRCEEGGFQLMNVEGVAIKEGFAIDNGLGNYVPKFNVTLRIVEREITVTAHSASKSFDGTALTEEGYDTENVAEGDAVAVTITGEQICMGTGNNVPSDAVITRTADNDRDVTDSYIVNYVNGTLTVTEAEAGAFTCPEAETKTMKDCELTMTVTVEGEPTVEGIADGSYTVENNLAELNPMSEGVHEITWTMKDNCGNVVASCTQTVTLQYGECTGTAGYEAVRIGSQCWMKENLKDAVGTYKAYKDDNANLEKFGYLYTWYTAMGLDEGDDSTDPWANAPTDACGNPYVQGICPDGWAVGSDADYALLGATAGDASFLKDPSTEYWLPEKAGVVEGNLGFNARGGGWYNSTLGDFEDIYAAFRYWTPDSEPGAYATSGSINYFCGTPQTLTNKKSDMMSVRCIRKVQE